MHEYQEFLKEQAQAEDEARRLASFRASLEEVQNGLEWAVGNMAAIQTRFVAAKLRLERCAPEDRAEYQQELEDTCQRRDWAGTVLIEAQERVAICSEELAEELARQGLSQEGLS